MRPRSFNIGFGPPLLKVTRNGIDYAIRAIPLGGFVKIPGMYRPSPDDVDTHLGRSLREAPELTGPTKTLRRALADENESRARGALSEIEERGAERNITGFKRGLQELQDALSPHAYWRQSTWRRVAVIAAGPLTNLVFAVLIFSVIFMVAASTATTQVDRVLPDRPAVAAGLQADDTIVSINGARVAPSDITRTISSSKGRPLTLTVLRHGELVRLGPVRPQRDPRDGAFRLGFLLRVKTERLGVGEAFWRSLRLTGVVTRETVKSLGRLVHKEGRDQIKSPVGIVQVSSSAAHESWEDYLGVLGFISLSLALLNLLPLLPLDGGHIAFAIIEGIRGRAVSRAIYERFSAVGIALVLLLFFVGLTNDVGRPGG
jgi:regulator of sigma E protease